MVRGRSSPRLLVCRVGGTVVLCDGLAPDDPIKAKALNAMEVVRDPSTVAFRPLGYYLDLFAAAGLRRPVRSLFQVQVERDALVAGSFPADRDRDALRRMIDNAVDGDLLGMNATREGGTVLMSYLAVILAAQKNTESDQALR